MQSVRVSKNGLLIIYNIIYNILGKIISLLSSLKTNYILVTLDTRMVQPLSIFSRDEHNGKYSTAPREKGPTYFSLHFRFLLVNCSTTVCFLLNRSISEFNNPVTLCTICYSKFYLPFLYGLSNTSFIEK